VLYYRSLNPDNNDFEKLTDLYLMSNLALCGFENMISDITSNNTHSHSHKDITLIICHNNKKFSTN
jgi:hypothetical protein